MSNIIELEFNQKMLKGGNTPTIFHTSFGTGVAAINPGVQTQVAHHIGVTHISAIPTPVASGLAAINPAVYTPVAHHTGVAHIPAVPNPVASGVASINPAVISPLTTETVPINFNDIATILNEAVQDADARGVSPINPAVHTNLAHTGIAYN